jgi:hypothetical protein
MARLKKDIVALEKARDNCIDSGLRKLIEAWIEEAKKKLGTSQ